MAVYVDDQKNVCANMQMCHMLADTTDELHAMADRMGLKRAWFQPKSFPHYDLSQSKRKQAICLGAVEITGRQAVQIIRRLRAVAKA